MNGFQNWKASDFADALSRPEAYTIELLGQRGLVGLRLRRLILLWSVVVVKHRVSAEDAVGDGVVLLGELDTRAGVAG